MRAARMMQPPTSSSLHSLQDKLLQVLPRAFQYVIAYSGGMDSQVLLHALAAVQEQLPGSLHAVHVHHGLQSYADEWAAFCYQSAEALAVDFTQLNITVDPDHPDGLEAAARHARYDALADWLPRGALLLTAHHQRDQAETLLLQLLRGAGPRGLASMPQETGFAKGTFLRPLLDMPYAHLQDYAEEYQLDWVEDPSNEDPRFDRNLLRQGIMPLLRERWEGLDQVLSRAARHQASAMRLMDDMARFDLKGARGSSAHTLSVHALLGMPPYRRDNLLRYWIQARGFRLPNETVLQHVTPELLKARNDAMPCVQWGNTELRRYQDNLFLFEALSPVPAGWQTALPQEATALPAGGRVVPETNPGQGINTALFARGSWTLGYRKGGERMLPAGDAHTRSLKQLLQENAIPPWIRERLPLVFCDDQLVAVAHLWVAEGYQTDQDKPGMLYKFDLLD